MSDPDGIKYEIICNFNKCELRSWIEQRITPEGIELVGMGRKIERDWKTGEVVSDITEPTGLVARYE